MPCPGFIGYQLTTIILLKSWKRDFNDGSVHIPLCSQVVKSHIAYASIYIYMYIYIIIYKLVFGRSLRGVWDASTGYMIFAKIIVFYQLTKRIPNGCWSLDGDFNKKQSIEFHHSHAKPMPIWTNKRRHQQIVFYCFTQQWRNKKKTCGEAKRKPDFMNTHAESRGFYERAWNLAISRQDQ